MCGYVLVYIHLVKQRKVTLETELNNANTTSNTTNDVDKVEETYKGLY